MGTNDDGDWMLYGLVEGKLDANGVAARGRRTFFGLRTSGDMVQDKQDASEIIGAAIMVPCWGVACGLVE